MRTQEANDMFEMVGFLSSGQIMVFLYPVTKPFVDLAIEFVGEGITKLSTTVGIQVSGHILSKRYPGEHYLFEFLLGFEIPVWISLALVMILNPLTLALIDKSFSGFFKNLWDYSYLILSEQIPKMPKSSLKRSFVSLWLLTCTILLAGFQGVLREFFIKAVPNNDIDSWEELYRRKELRISSPQVSFIRSYAELNAGNDKMAKSFLERIDIVDMFNFSNFIPEIEATIRGERVVSTELHNIEEMLLRDISRDKLQLLHVSKNGAGISPYFIVFNSRIKPEIERLINTL
jgi:hypothetical protein